MFKKQDVREEKVVFLSIKSGINKEHNLKVAQLEQST